MAQELGKPLLVEEFGAARPAARRNAFFEMVFEELGAARAAGLPVAGSLVWMLAAGGYPDYDSFTVYADREPYWAQPTGIFLQAPPAAVAAAAADTAAAAEFLNRREFVECIGRRSNGTAGWNDGWQDTLALLRQQTAAAAAAAAGAGG